MTDRELAVSAWESLFRAQVGVLRVLGTEFPTKEMSLNEYDVLFNLSLQPERRARLRDINQLVLLSQPSVSRLIDRLVARGLVSKHPDPNDKRGTIVAITDAGFAKYRDVARTHMATITELMGSALTDEELGQLKQLTSKLRVPDGV
ncbi:DNA-binding MarR family transcriptional regulator [Okibacterium sp. HSC-33S16]|uniref:MarR family winged helix-turn-helix transcriptional regulator n=1 Tax=Okibacterium sp. HSC-33S16 TaxID=2910965 RepID=UPI00209FBCAF|nr:MarR family transcriptional regulator [Okibacterium sp. HSC-33S16]MCP2032467.1 DNA-binding MarR family transcriptional regulator [Okibacterium sp. HSC-33S16]